MPRYDKPMNAMGGEYIQSFAGSASPYIWLSDEKIGVGTINYYAHPLGAGVPNVSVIPTNFGAVFLSSVNTATTGSIGITATANGTFKILALM